MPYDAVEKVAYGGWDAMNFALRFLPAGAGEEVKEKIKEKAAGAAA